MKPLIFLFLLLTSSAFSKPKPFTEVIDDIKTNLRNQIELTYFIDETIEYENITTAKLHLKIYIHYQEKLTPEEIPALIQSIISECTKDTECYVNMFLRLKKLKISAHVTYIKPFTGKPILASLSSSDKINHLDEGDQYARSCILSNERSWNRIHMS